MAKISKKDLDKFISDNPNSEAAQSIKSQLATDPPKEIREELDVVAKIVNLHSEIKGYTMMSLEKGIEIGGLLVEQKAKVKHGEWKTWMTTHLPFSHSSAQKYMRLFNSRDFIENADSVFLDEADALMANKKWEKARADRTKKRKAFADKPSDYVAPKGKFINQPLVGDNLEVMQQLLDNGMGGKVDACISSPPYNAGGSVYYGENIDDDLPMMIT